ncbi:hypothetical protein BGZ60DRAFT_408213 [Tricladium varicosporioides]|nr:hypothetical protein BGZ60DRAFT_408213 [Hymenoscyphus varicosporioides]
MISIRGEIKSWAQNASNDKHHRPVKTVNSKITAPLLDGQADKSATTAAKTLDISVLPHAFERWEILSSRWEGLMTFWTHRLEENKHEIAQDDIKTQLSKQVTDLSAAGQNLFHAVTELQHLKASSERKFQRWFFEMKAEKERSQVIIAGLKNSLEVAQQQLEEVLGSRREDRHELQVVKEEILRAREKIERNAVMEKRRADRLESGRSIEIGDVILTPHIIERANGTSELLPNKLQKVKKPKIPKDWEARWIDEERNWSYINQETNETQRKKPRPFDSQLANQQRDTDVDGTPGSSTSPNRKGSAINNPKLFESVEDAIRRLILPELTVLKRKESRKLKEQRATKEDEAKGASQALNPQPDAATDLRSRRRTALHKARTSINCPEISQDSRGAIQEINQKATAPKREPLSKKLEEQEPDNQVMRKERRRRRCYDSSG